MNKATENKYRRAYDKLTPAQQREVSRKAQIADDASKAYATARDALHKLGMEQETAFAAYVRFAKSVGLPAEAFE